MPRRPEIPSWAGYVVWLTLTGLSSTACYHWGRTVEREMSVQHMLEAAKRVIDARPQDAGQDR